MKPAVCLFHWHAAEARERAGRLEALGYRVTCHSSMRPDVPKRLARTPPAAVVIDLERLPSQGREVGVALRCQAATRRVPLVFVGGAEAKVARVVDVLPDARFTTWGKLAAALKSAIAKPPASVVVPRDRLAAYSGTPLPKKLGIREGTRVALVGAPEEFEATLGALPEGAGLQAGARGRFDLLLWFIRSAAELRRGIVRTAAVTPTGGTWIAWPKKTSPLAADVGEKEVRAAGLAHGLVDYKVCAIDSTWSGLKFARRK